MARKKLNILLLTNRDSDNVGDQIIEGSAIGLLKAAMKNLGFSNREYKITSKAAGIIGKKYLETNDPTLLENADRLIGEADVVVFGGAPLFNYSYQSFYRRTIKTLELAQKHNTPVLFSSIGVEPFDESNKKCLQLQKALALPCVKQVTTRDDFESLQQFITSDTVPIAKVADPAVYADSVFIKRRNWTIRGVARVLRRRLRKLVRFVRGGNKGSQKKPKRKKIALLVTRAGIFEDNGIDFSEEQQRAFWKSVMELLDKKGYDYKLLTTGHFSDEVFLDAFVREENIPYKKYSIATNSPEELIGTLRSSAGVIAYRLHASITSYSYKVPSVGLTWNFKVPYFYESVGYPERVLDSKDWNAETVVAVLERAMAEGVAKDGEYSYSVYRTLFEGLKGVFKPASSASPYSPEVLPKRIPAYRGTTQKMYKQKVQRKLRRTYDNYQKLSLKKKS